MSFFTRMIASFTAGLLAIVTVASVSLRGQTENRSPSVSQEKVDPTLYPLTDFDSQESNDPIRGNLRRARNQRYDIADTSITTQELKNFELKETDIPVLFELIPSHAPEEPALPVTQSNAIAIGQVIAAQAHLSNDRTRVYSEFQVRVEEVLKNDNIGPLVSGGLITTERAGGRVRFSSGKTLLRGSYGRSMPRLERRYLFFLKYNNQGQDYSIITAYELRDRRVFPLDGSRKGSEETPAFAANRTYENAEEASFVREVQSAMEKARLK
jgi:hypothetical protein